MHNTINVTGQNPQFGMAFRMPTDKSELVKLGELVKIDTRIGKRGFAQLKKEMDKCKHFDLKFHPSTEKDSIQIIDNQTGKVVNEYSSNRWQGAAEPFVEHEVIPFFSERVSMDKPFRKTLARLFAPKKFMPEFLYNAAENAKKLEQEAVKAESIVNELNKLA